MKKLYIAAPFFNEQQLALVQAVEAAVAQTPGLLFYSPRMDGVLKDMTPEQRKAAGPKLFKLNVHQIRSCDAVLALKDYSDTGTTWETGYAYGIGRPVYGYRTNPSQPLNIMIQQCMDAVVYGPDQLAQFLQAYSGNGDVSAWTVGKDLGETY
jgi:nucleoside 2-deoxyribosyltransferase